ncbi:hypothetical protein HRbin20_01738 [bacterium HR20]|nr:hypothetical protein HRbin20_01738 [bacterium HR20]
MNRLGESAAIASPFQRQLLDFEAFDSNDTESFVEKVERQGVSCRAHSDNEHLAPIVGKWVRSLQPQRVPPCQQVVEFDAPRQVQHIGEHTGFDLRDIDWLLLLEDAAFHAIVANAMASACAEGIVDCDHHERSERIALRFECVHLANVLIERATSQGDIEGVPPVASIGIPKAGRAGIFLALVADHAVVKLPEDIPQRCSRIGQCEAIPPSKMPATPAWRRCTSILAGKFIALGFDERGHIELPRHPAEHPPRERFWCDGAANQQILFEQSKMRSTALAILLQTMHKLSKGGLFVLLPAEIGVRSA